MLKQVLYLKYRPQTLNEMVGNEEIVDVLRGQLKGETQPLPKSILLHGPTGCGKTTLARIIANELGVKGDDLREVDSADFRGIDTIREIRKQTQFKPLESPYRIWILDECHKLTNDAQNALLKILEDTPEHVYFILCTTEPEKLIKTIRGRCASYAVTPLSDRNMKKLLINIVNKEEESLSRELYERIVQDSLGLPRNALQILSQVLAADEKDRMKIAERTAELQSKTIELCRALVKMESWKKISTILQGLKDENPEQIRRAVLGYCQAILLNNQNNTVAIIMEEFIHNFYDTGFPGLVFACYSVKFGGE